MSESLPNLPPTEHEYWELSEVALHKLEDPQACEHYFEETGTGEIGCKKCGVGYFIGVGDTIRDGCLFHFDKKVI